MNSRIPSLPEFSAYRSRRPIPRALNAAQGIIVGVLIGAAIWCVVILALIGWT
jgi:hypothetical protein